MLVMDQKDEANLWKSHIKLFMNDIKHGICMRRFELLKEWMEGRKEGRIQDKKASTTTATENTKTAPEATSSASLISDKE